MKEHEIETFKQTLLELKLQLNRVLQGTAEEVKAIGDAKGYSQHQADEGTDDFNKVISMELSNKELNILKQVNRALEKIEESTYGCCDITGKEIPRKRLEAVPYAVMTVEAQEKLEKGLL